MSAFVSVTYPDSVRLLTDGAIYTEDGTLRAVRRKVWASDALPLAITGRSNMMDAVGVLAMTILTMARVMPNRSFDGLIAGMGGEFLDAIRERGFPRDIEAEFLLAGWSESEGPVHYYFSSFVSDDYNPGVEPFTLIKGPPSLMAGAQIETIFEDLASIGITQASMTRSETMRERGADIMETMRRRPGPNPVAPTKPWVFGIGGQCDLTTITQERATIETLRRWPDRVGEKIDPFEGENIQAMSRQQRRALERGQRKAMRKAG